jgi:hypothetical protein
MVTNIENSISINIKDTHSVGIFSIITTIINLLLVF